MFLQQSTGGQSLSLLRLRRGARRRPGTGSGSSRLRVVERPDGIRPVRAERRDRRRFACLACQGRTGAAARDGLPPGGGIAHLVEPDPSVRGLLVDQVLAAAATLDAHEASGDDVYLDLALEIMSYALGSMRDARSGGFLDRASLDDGTEIGLLREPMMPIDLNGEAAQVLLRLARVSGQEEFR